MKMRLQYAMSSGLLLLLSFCSACGKCDPIPGVTLESKSHQYVASTNGSNCGFILSELDSYVEIRRSYYVGGHRFWTAKKTIAGGKLSPNRLRLEWVDDQQLSVSCDCRKETLDFADDRWRDVSVTYTFTPQ
jgi:hypothetical protein